MKYVLFLFGAVLRRRKEMACGPKSTGVRLEGDLCLAAFPGFLKTDFSGFDLARDLLTKATKKMPFLNQIWYIINFSSCVCPPRAGV